MKKRTVIKNLPVRMPLNNTVLWFLVCKYLDVSDIVWAIYGCVSALLWIVYLFVKNDEVEVDLDDYFDKPEVSHKSRFQMKMDEMMIAKNKSSTEP